MCALEARWQLAAKDLDGVRRVRRSVKGLLSPLAFDKKELDNVELIVGELSANALRYSDGPVSVYVSHCDEHLQIEVADEGAGFKLSSRGLPAADQPGGRGLFIVESLSDSLRNECKDGKCIVIATIASSCVTEIRQTHKTHHNGAPYTT